MLKFDDIRKFILAKSKILFLFCCVLMLAACGEGDDDLCPSLQDGSNTCPLCKFFEIMKNAAQKVADGAWDYLAVSLATVVIVISAIYITLYTLRMVTSFGKQTLADYFTGDKMGLFFFMFKVAIIVLLLMSKQIWGVNEFLKYVIAPLLQAGFEIGAGVSNVGGQLYGSGSYPPTWDGIFQMTYETAREFNMSVNYVVGIGKALACNATEGLPWDWKFLQLIYGSLTFIFGWFLLATVSFYLVDLIVRLTFGAVLLSVGIACAVSKLSMPYTKNIWNLFVNVFFSVIILGILIALILQMVELCVGVGAESPAVNAYVFNIQSAIDGNRISELSGAMANFGHMLLIVVCFSIMIQLVEQGRNLASDISETSIANSITPSKAATPLANIAKNAGKRGLTWTGNATLKGAQSAGRSLARKTGLDKKYDWVRGRLFGRGPQGHTAFWHKWW